MSVVLDRLAGGGGNSSHENLHSAVLQFIVRVDSLLGIVFVVLEGKLKLQSVHAAGVVYLLNRKRRAVLYGCSVGGSTAGRRTHSADLDGVGRTACFAAAGYEGSGKKQSRRCK